MLSLEGGCEGPEHWSRDRLSPAPLHLLHHRLHRSLLRTAVRHGAHLQPCDVTTGRNRRDVIRGAVTSLTYSLVVWTVWSRQRPGELTVSGLRLENKLRKQVRSTYRPACLYIGYKTTANALRRVRTHVEASELFLEAGWRRPSPMQAGMRGAQTGMPPAEIRSGRR